MKTLKLSTVLMGLALLGFAGCGSSDSDGDLFPDADIVFGNQDAGVSLFGITPGAYCYTITSVSGVNDGCGLEVGTLVGKSLPGSYDATTGILTLGTQGSLGGGPISNNAGTLVRVKGLVNDTAVPGCSWNQADTTAVVLTDTNKLTASVTETQDTIAAACGLAVTTCTSSWTWTMELTTAQVGGLCP